MPPSPVPALLSITRISPSPDDSIASRKTPTLPKCFAGSARPAIRAVGISEQIPTGATRIGRRMRSAASAIRGVESSAKFSVSARLFIRRLFEEDRQITLPKCGHSLTTMAAGLVAHWHDNNASAWNAFDFLFEDSELGRVDQIVGGINRE